MSRGERLATGALLALAGLGALSLLRAAFATYTWGLFGMGDFATYTNMLWNTAHGAWFACRIDENYLVNHLSFTLVLLAPLFRVWDHPFLLAVVQWAIVVAGGAVLYAFGRRAGVPSVFRAALALFFILYHFTQSLLIAEFHGVALYHLLAPCLLYACVYRRSMVWLPLLLILGVREDAVVIAVPLLCYCARSGRWRGGWWWAAASVAYAALAMLVIYPAINGFTLMERRQRELALASTDITGSGYRFRLIRGLAWVVVPAAAAALASWAPLLFPSAVWLQNMLASTPRQQLLGGHYGGPVMALLACGLMEAARVQVARGGLPGARAWAWRAAALVLVTLVSHTVWGYAPLGGRAAREHLRIESTGLEAQAVAARIPGDGALLADDDLVGFAGNRSDVINYKHYHPIHHAIRYYFVETARLDRRLNGRLAARLATGDCGVREDEGRFLVLERGGPTGENARVLADYRDRIYLAATPGRHGDTRFVDGRQVRHWIGNGSRSPCDLSHGATWRLQPGAYEASLIYRAATPARDVRRSWGWIRLHEAGDERPLQEVELARAATPEGGWSTQAVAFALERRCEVDLRVVGADAELSLHHWRLRRVE